MEIKAIETEYNGYRFRSRLEARWAVFFDALGVEYEYEPEGFQLPNGAYYLPDFKLKCHGTRGSWCGKPFDLWVEVKGKMAELDAEKIKDFAWGGADKDGILNSVLVVGNIPDDGYGAQSCDLKSYDDMDGCEIYPWNYWLIDGDYFACFPAATKDGKFYLDGDDCNYTTMDWRVIDNAFKAARQARFEHGETPKIIHRPQETKLYEMYGADESPICPHCGINLEEFLQDWDIGKKFCPYCSGKIDAQDWIDSINQVGLIKN